MKALKSLEFPEGALLFCLAAALLFAVLAALGYFEDSRFLQRAVRASGEVVAVRMRTEVERKENQPRRVHHYYRPVVAFSDAKYERIEFVGRYETHLEDRWNTGMKVAVLYPKDDPAAARIDDPSEIHASFRAMRTMVIVSLAVGGVLYGLAKFEASRKPRPVYQTDDEARRAYFGE